MKPNRATTLFAMLAAYHGMQWTLSASPKFGANALRVRGKIFAALTRKHRLLLKLPPARVSELIAAKRAKRFESGGRTMNGWITLAPDNKREWIALSDEARTFVAMVTKLKKKTR